MTDCDVMIARLSRDGLSLCSVQASCVFVGNRVGEVHACLGVDIQAPRAAPLGKRFGIDDGAHYGLSVAAQVLLYALGYSSPFVERSGELVPIGHDPADGAVLFGTIPGEADDEGGRGHGGLRL